MRRQSTNGPPLLFRPLDDPAGRRVGARPVRQLAVAANASVDRHRPPVGSRLRATVEIDGNLVRQICGKFAGRAAGRASLTAQTSIITGSDILATTRQSFMIDAVARHAWCRLVS